MRNLLTVVCAGAVMWMGSARVKAEVFATVVSTLSEAEIYDYPYEQETVGTLFRVGDESIWVTHLGIWDQDEDGLTASYRVGVFSATTMLLLFDAVVPSGTEARLEAGTRWVEVSPFFLESGLEYVVATYRPLAVDVFPHLFTDEGVFGPEITPLEDVYEISAGLMYPTGIEECDAILGPSFQYATQDPTTAPLMFRTPGLEPGRRALTIRGTLGATYAVERSSDLVNWEVIATQRLTVDNFWDFEDGEDVAGPGLFYRAVAVE